MCDRGAADVPATGPAWMLTSTIGSFSIATSYSRRQLLGPFIRMLPGRIMG